MIKSFKAFMAEFEQWRGQRQQQLLTSPNNNGEHDVKNLVKVVPAVNGYVIALDLPHSATGYDADMVVIERKGQDSDVARMIGDAVMALVHRSEPAQGKDTAPASAQ